MLLSKCAVCDSKISKFIIEQEARRFLSKLPDINIQTLATEMFKVKNEISLEITCNIFTLRTNNR